MIRFIGLCCLFFMIAIQGCFALETKRIDYLLDTIESDYKNEVDYKKISNNLFKEINTFDKNLRIYNSGKKAFLYKENSMIKAFNLPENNNRESWKNLLTNLIEIVSENSVKINDNYNNFEMHMVKTISRGLDKYSRTEKTSNNIKKVTYEVKDNIIVIKTFAFYKGISSDIRDIVLKNKHCSGLILDLRDNKGGDFGEAIRTSDLFLDDALITYSVEKNDMKKYFKSSKGDILEGKSIAILVNKLTASASEVVVGALSEQSRATIIGTNTYGKGTLQTIHNIDNNIIYITHGFFYTPSGKKIEDVGISPQICTGIDNKCNIANKNPNNDVLIGINLIKNKIG